MVPMVPVTVPVALTLNTAAVTPVTVLLNATSKLTLLALLSAVEPTWRLMLVTVGAGRT